MSVTAAQVLNADISALRAEFPALHQEVNGRPLAYLDSAASAQIPQCVIDAIAAHYREDHANVHRGVHTLSERSTVAYEGAREKLRQFVNAGSTGEIIFTRGTTEGLNLVASSLGNYLLRPGDDVLVSGMEHHSNIVPWQFACARTGANLRVIPMTETGELDRDAYRALLSEQTRIVALTHVSNALGTVNPIAEMAAEAHAVDAAVVVDGAQAAPHLPIDVAALGADFYAFSGHKMFAPTGIGVLYGSQHWLERIPPYQGGGEMILTVTFEASTFNDLPYKFEAGTPNISGAIAMGAAADFLRRLDPHAVAAHEHDLLTYATQQVRSLDGIRLIGTARDKVSVLSFLLDGIHAHDLGTIVDQAGVAIRTGHHCAMPVMDFFDVPATARASFALYNNREDIDRLMAGLNEAIGLFR